MNKQFRTYNEAKKFVQLLKLKSQKEWAEYCKSRKKPKDIPANPRSVYKNKGWKSSGDWLGTGIIASYNIKFRSFENSRKFVHSLKLKSYDEWIDYTKSGKKPNDIPSYPMRTYRKKGWKGMSDWLANGRSKELRNFNDARNFIQKLKFTNRNDWEKFCKSGKKPNDIPKSPSNVYKNKGWISWGDWLGTGFVATRKRKHRSFFNAKKFVHSLNLKSQKEWAVYCMSGKKPENITSHPNRSYKKEWKSWGDWLGTGILSNTERSKNFLLFSDARKIIRELAKKYNINTNRDWDNAVKNGLIPDNIPSAPWAAYSKKRKK